MAPPGVRAGLPRAFQRPGKPPGATVIRSGACLGTLSLELVGKMSQPQAILRHRSAHETDRPQRQGVGQSSRTRSSRPDAARRRPREAVRRGASRSSGAPRRQAARGRSRIEDRLRELRVARASPGGRERAGGVRRPRGRPQRSGRHPAAGTAQAERHSGVRRSCAQRRRRCSPCRVPWIRSQEPILSARSPPARAYPRRTLRHRDCVARSGSRSAAERSKA